MKSYIKDEWTITSVEDIPIHKVKRFKFKSNEEYSIDGYPAHRCVEIDCKSEEEAWEGLEELIKRKYKNNA